MCILDILTYSLELYIKVLYLLGALFLFVFIRWS